MSNGPVVALKYRCARMLLASLTTAAPFALAPAVAHAHSAGTTFQLTTIDDTNDANPGDGICADANGACSLRAAVEEANVLGGSIVVRTQPDKIYVLSNAGADEDAALTGDLDVAGDILIVGRDSIVDAAGLDRAFDVQLGGRLEVRDLTVMNGAVTDANGGGYRSAGTLILKRSEVLNSSALGTGASGGAIANEGGTLEVRSSTLSGNDSSRAGGAVEANAGDTLILLSDLSDNTTGPAPGNGGAFHLTGAGSVEVRDTTVTGNTAAREGGGLWNSAVGTMEVRDSTISGNAGNGSESHDGGGGIFNDGGHMEVFNSTISLNTATMGSGSGGGAFNNGGTMIFRGTTLEHNLSNRAGGGIEALGGDTQVLASFLIENSTGAVPGNGGGLHLSGSGTVTVSATEVLGNDAASEGGGLWNSAGGTMNIDNTLIEGNVASGDASDNGGGGLFNEGGVMIARKIDVIGNIANGAAGSGGGILNNAGSLEVRNSLLDSNTSNRAGGGIESNGGLTTVRGSILFGNVTGAAPGNGGAFHLTGDGEVWFLNCAVGFNDAAAEGGGLWNSAVGDMFVYGCAFLGNTAAGNDPDQGGGALFNDGGSMLVDDSTFDLNEATGTSGSGGGILNNNGSLIVTKSLFVLNTSNRAGGGIEANDGETFVSDTLFASNSTGPSPGNGGALHLTGAGYVEISGGIVFYNNASNEGGGLWNSSTGTMDVYGTELFMNFAPVGPDVFNDGGTFWLDGEPVPTGG